MVNVPPVPKKAAPPLPDPVPKLMVNVPPVPKKAAPPLPDPDWAYPPGRYAPLRPPQPGRFVLPKPGFKPPPFALLRLPGPGKPLPVPGMAASSSFVMAD